MLAKHKRLKIAIVHDYLRTYGGGERVLEELHNIWPNAQIYTATADYDRMGIFGSKFKKMNINTSWAQYIYPFVKKPILYRPFLPLIWPTLKLKDVDVVISSSGSNMAKGVKIPKGAKHICYCHTPPRFLYGYKTETNIFNNPLFKNILGYIFRYIKNFDIKSNKNVNIFIANSINVQKRIKEIYGRESNVVYPPTVSDRSRIHYKSKGYYLVVSRLVNYKNIDLIIKAFNQLNFKLIIVGNGTERRKLQKMANENIKFVGEVSDKTLQDYYKNCTAFVSATSDEDFGMTIPEAAGFGKPSIAYYSGGAKETVIDGITGIFFYKLTASSLINAIKTFNHTKFNSKKIWKFSQKFSENNFINKIIAIVNQL